MFSDQFYHSLIRKYVSYFGAIFSNCYINRTMPDGSKGAVMMVPIQYAAKEKMLVRLLGDPNIDRKDALALPAMSFELKSMTYAPERKVGTTKPVTRTANTTNKSFRNIYAMVPYDLEFSLYIMVKNLEDGAKITEQIYPFFAPEWTATLELIPEMGIEQDIPIVLQRTQLDDVLSEDYKERRTLMYTMDFKMKAYFWGPVVKKPLIQFTTVNYKIADDLIADDNVNALTIVTKPGLTANGQPTSNSAASVPLDDINMDSDYGYIVTFTSSVP